MRVTFLSQTGFVAEHEGRRFVMDPWLTDGAFEGAWYHYPPQRLTAADLGSIDALYISHLHSDHCDPSVLAQIDKRVPVFILDRQPNFLERYLRERGFQDLRLVRDGVTVRHSVWEITLYQPFAGHNHFEARIGNLIDSSILLRAGGTSFLNFTDNFPTPAAAARLAAAHGTITLAAVPYNGAGDYPACCQSLSDDEKIAERDRLMARNLARLAEVAEALRPELLSPTSAEYVLAGALASKNQFLMQVSAIEAAADLARRGYGGRIVTLREGTRVDLATRTLEETLPAPTVPSREAYAETLRAVRFEHELDPPVSPLELEGLLIPALREARAHLWARQRQLGFSSDWHLAIAVGDQDFVFRWDAPGCDLVAPRSVARPYLRFELDLRLLRRLMDRRSHWNNASVGCHVEFWREPNVYDPDLWTMLSFLHPRQAPGAASRADEHAPRTLAPAS